MKIPPGASAPQLVFDSGPLGELGTPAPANYDGTQPPWSGGSGGKRCVACHTVSKDGSTLAANFERQGRTDSPYGIINLTAPSPSVTQMSSYDTRAVFMTLTPDGKEVVRNDIDFTLRLADAAT